MSIRMFLESTNNTARPDLNVGSTLLQTGDPDGIKGVKRESQLAQAFSLSSSWPPDVSCTATPYLSIMMD
jgi:hypothetical protein